MKVVKSILLSSAAGFLAVAGAQAADLPSKKAAPVQYVKICDAYGAGFFFIPGTDTCVRIGGFVRAEYQYTPGKAVRTATAGAVTQVGGDQDQTGMEIRGRIDVDARTQTAWGTVQTVVQLRGTNTDGIRNGPATVSNATGYAPAANGSTSMTMERAYIRFAGFTAGVGSQNFVTFPSYVYHSNISAGFPNGIKQLAYTATFGGGFSATVAIESKYDYNGSNGVTNWTSNNQPGSGQVFVANVRADQAWGFVQLSGAITSNTFATTGAPVTTNGIAGAPGNNLLSGSSSMTAWAIGLGARINLPMIAPGDQFNLSMAYAQGLNGLVGCSVISDCSDSSSKRSGGGVLYVIPNAILTSSVAGVNTYAQTKSWNVAGIFTHYWTPSWRSNLEVGYNQILVPTAAASAGLQLGSASIWGVIGNVIWSPVPRFDIGVELAYYQSKFSLQNAPAAFVAAGNPGTSTNNWSGKLRLERTF